MLNEFKAFIAKGNVMDMAVGIIVGAAFTAIVKSMVDDIINPIIGLIVGGLDFTNLFFVLGAGEFETLAAAREAGAAVFAYGSFVTAIINFLIIAFVVFMLVRYVNKVKDSMTAKEVAEAAPEPAPAGPTQEDLLTEIRDLLKKA